MPARNLRKNSLIGKMCAFLRVANRFFVFSSKNSEEKNPAKITIKEESKKK